jgi:hypothetical protein
MTQTHWLEFGPADFDSAQASPAARKRAAGEAGQGTLFFVPVPVKTASSTRGRGRLPGQAGIFEITEES